MKTETGITTICPACGSHANMHEIRSYSAEESAAYFCPPSRDTDRNLRLKTAINLSWPDGHAAIRLCKECGFGCAWPHVGGNDAFYETLHEQAGYPSWRWDYDRAFASPAFISAGGKALDIGAGSGVFLQRLPPGWKSHAVESSPITRELLESKGIITYANLTEAKSNGPYDFISLFQVLEHLAPFEPIVANAANLLAPGGWIFITVPHGPMMTEQEHRIGCPDMPPNHVNRWTPESLRRVLNRHGLEVKEAQMEPNQFRLIQVRLHLIIMSTAATRPNSFSAMVYRIRHRVLRIPLLACLAAGFLVRHLGDIRWMQRGGAFALSARKVNLFD